QDVLYPVKHALSRHSYAARSAGTQRSRRAQRGRAQKGRRPTTEEPEGPEARGSAPIDGRNARRSRPELRFLPRAGSRQRWESKKGHRREDEGDAEPHKQHVAAGRQGEGDVLPLPSGGGLAVECASTGAVTGAIGFGQRARRALLRDSPCLFPFS